MVVLHWLYTLWFGYTWPSLKGNGPEALVQTVVYAAIAYAFYPPFRAWLKREGSKLHDKIDLLHAKADHVIEHHPDVPPFEG